MAMAAVDRDGCMRQSMAVVDTHETLRRGRYHNINIDIAIEAYTEAAREPSLFTTKTKACRL